MSSLRQTGAAPSARKQEELWAEARRHLVGGVNSPVRAYAAVHGDPPFVERAEGACVYTADGRRLVDFVGSFGPLVLGHAHPAVVDAVLEAARRGTSFAAPHEGEVRLAAEIKERIPAIEKLRLVNSGTEAVQSAVRLARGFTGRDGIVKFEGCYHGHVDALLVEAGSGLATFGIASSAGVTRATAEETHVLPLDDESAVERLFDRLGDELAAVIVEPLPANHGLLPQRVELLATLRRCCDRAGAVLVFDEVITGLRVPAGSIGNEVEIQPDLYTLGKVIGGGLPVGAYGGRSEIMDLLAPLGPVYQAGTLSGNPIAVAAGRATLAEMERADAHAVLERLGRRLEAELAPVLAASPHPYSLVRRHSLFWLAYGEDPLPRRIGSFPPQTGAVFADLHRELLQRGFLLAPSAFEVGFLSTAHTEEQLVDFAQAVAQSLERVEPRA